MTYFPSRFIFYHFALLQPYAGADGQHQAAGGAGEGRRGGGGEGGRGGVVGGAGENKQKREKDVKTLDRMRVAGKW